MASPATIIVHVALVAPVVVNQHVAQQVSGSWWLTRINMLSNAVEKSVLEFEACFCCRMS